MFWPVILPAQITAAVFAVVIAVLIVMAPVFRQRRLKMGLTAIVMSGLLFIPSCGGVFWIVDSFRFGDFEYATYDEVQDFRIERYLPPGAFDIALTKQSHGHSAQYSITQKDLTEFLDDCWDRFGGNSAVSRDRLDDGTLVESKTLNIKWKRPPAEFVFRYDSPVQSDGGGASYVFDPTNNAAMHTARYW